MNFKTAVFVFCSLFVTLLASAQDVSAPDSIDLFLQSKMQRLHIPALQVAVVRDGKIVKNKTYGIANLENNIPATDKTIFSVNSITKAFTGVAVMQLAEEGKLDINAPLSRYLDSLPPKWQGIMLQQVLTHISGLPDMLDAEEQVLGHNDESEAMQKVKALPMEFSVGEKFQYNQTGYVLLGQIITKLSGMHFTKFIEERQFKVAGMNLTRFGDSYDVIPNYAGAYTMTRQVGNDFVRNKVPGIGYMQFPVFFRTAAGIQSTATDMANWIIALKTGRLLKQQNSIAIMWTPAILNNGKIGGFNKLTNGYALGWPTVTRKEHPAVGPVGGGRSALFVYLKDDLSIVVLTNLMGGNPDRFIDEIAGYYIPDMHEANGFGLPENVKKLRTALLKQGFANANKVTAGLKQADPLFTLNEQELNAWGYQLLGQKKAAEALYVFKLNTTLFPKSANAYDSLGEIQELTGNKKEALLSYRQSLTLNPENKNAANRIAELGGK
ncbi:serine hydrolase domain-containing protein [Mucilaginibacter ginsenosidivorax]|uniref:Serine hydrolase n=1 Tax=Mucilaginibacter ginsenosidivorax TaxID=862126 RepID=A0A5B8VVZ3_9SPHI|nr:serine hydrolase domain-containing protein [Mucilaginibacter ginsenosidivorax]QEC75767.1 serine hydrolase [Mucilaginibacter ginsenosidivorax]